MSTSRPSLMSYPAGLLAILAVYNTYLCIQRHTQEHQAIIYSVCIHIGTISRTANIDISVVVYTIRIHEKTSYTVGLSNSLVTHTYDALGVRDRTLTYDKTASVQIRYIEGWGYSSLTEWSCCQSRYNKHKRLGSMPAVVSLI